MTNLIIYPDIASINVVLFHDQNILVRKAVIFGHDILNEQQRHARFAGPVENRE
jgi:hypothetical protein